MCQPKCAKARPTSASNATTSTAIQPRGRDVVCFGGLGCGSVGIGEVQGYVAGETHPMQVRAVALSISRGQYKKGYQEIRLPKYTRYIDDVADMAKIIRGEKQTDFSYEHDLHVQEAVLQASGVLMET